MDPFDVCSLTHPLTYPSLTSSAAVIPPSWTGDRDYIFMTPSRSPSGIPILPRGLSRLMTPIAEDPRSRFTPDPHWYDAGDMLRLRSVPRFGF